MISFLRSFLTSKKIWLAVVAGLMAAFTLATVMGAYIIGELRYDRWQTDSDRIYRLQMTLMPPQSGAIEIAGGAKPLRDAVTGQLSDLIQDATYFKVLPGTATIDDVDYSEDVYVGDSSFFDVFGADIIDQADSGALDEPNSVAISRSNAMRFFGEESAVSQRMQVNGYYDVTVTAVFEDFPENSHFRPGLIRLDENAYDTGYSLNDWTNISGYVYVKVLPGVDYEQLQSAMPAVISNSVPATDLPGEGAEANDLISVMVMPLHDIYTHSRANGELREPANTAMIWGLAAVSLFVLLLAAFNFATITLTLTLRRSREMVIRRYLGESRHSILLRLFAEISFMVAVALLPGALLARMLQPLVKSYIDGQAYFIGFGSFYYYLFVLAIGLLVVLICWAVTGYKFMRSLGTADRESTVSRSRGDLFLQRVLMALNFVVIIVILHFAYTVKNQYEYMQDQTQGYKKDGIAVFDSIDSVQGFVTGLMLAYQVVVELEPGTIDTSLVSVVPGKPISAQTGLSATIDGVERETVVSVVKAEHNFAEMMELELLAGRYFSEQIFTDQYTPEDVLNGIAGRVILNETAVSELGYPNPQAAIGEVVRLSDQGSQRLDVIGVVKDFNWNSYHEPIRPMALLNTIYGAGNMLIRSDARDLRQYLRTLDEKLAEEQPTWKDIRKGVVHSTLLETWRQQNSNERSLNSLMRLGSWFAALISIIGVLTIAVYGSQYMARSMAIRRILGEPLLWSFRAVAYPYVVIGAISSLLSFAIAYYLAQLWLTGFAEKLYPGPGIAFAIGAGILLLSIACAFVCLVLSRRKEPAEVLRVE